MARSTPPTFAPVPSELRSRVRAACAHLPEAEMADNGLGDVLRFRNRSFGTLLGVVPDDGGAPRSLLVLLADPEEQRVLLEVGHPYFRPPTAGVRIGVVLDDLADLDEIDELVTDAYRRVAPKYLTARLETRR